METLDEVETAFMATCELLVTRGIPIIRAQSVVASDAAVWVDFDVQADLLVAVSTVIDTCSIKFAVAVAAVDDDEEERAFLMVGDTPVGLHFGVEVKEQPIDPAALDYDPVVIEDQVRRLSASIVDRVSSTPGVEPTHRAKIRQLLDQLLDDEEADELVTGRLRSLSADLAHDVSLAVRRRHQVGFSNQARELAEKFREANPDADLTKVTVFRQQVVEFLRSIDPDCATKDSAEPIVQALRTSATKPPTSLF